MAMPKTAETRCGSTPSCRSQESHNVDSRRMEKIDVRIGLLV